MLSKQVCELNVALTNSVRTKTIEREIHMQDIFIYGRAAIQRHVFLFLDVSIFLSYPCINGEINEKRLIFC